MKFEVQIGLLLRPELLGLHPSVRGRIENIRYNLNGKRQNAQRIEVGLNGRANAGKDSEE